MEPKYPPLIQAFIDVQRKYPEFIILTEVGGFFEIWQIDELNLGHAERASQILDIVLTKRDKSKEDSPKMAGFPSYAVEGYIKKLVAHGETVVVVRQEITGKKSDKNKNVRRHIERIVSPATNIEEVASPSSIYFGGCFCDGEYAGLSLVDLSTGVVRVSEMTKENAADHLQKLKVKEVLFNSEAFFKKSSDQIFHVTSTPLKSQSAAGAILASFYEIKNPTSHHATTISQLGLERWPLATLALANLLNFLSGYNPLLLKKLSLPKIEPFESSLFLSKNAYLSLDIFESPLQPDPRKTLFGILNQCKTAMGTRALRHYLAHPLRSKKEIEKRHAEVERMIEKNEFLDELKGVYDISRMNRRMALKSLLPHELVGLCESIEVAAKVMTEFKHLGEVEASVAELKANLDMSVLKGQTAESAHGAFLGPLREKIQKTFENWQGAKERLDLKTKELSDRLGTSRLRVQDRLESLRLIGPKGLKEQCAKAGIKYKIKASEIEILDETWEALAYEELSLRSHLSLAAKKVFGELQEEFFKKYGDVLFLLSEAIGERDVLSTFARLSKERGYKKPLLSDKGQSKARLVSMRHPVLELSKDNIEAFVPNDIDLAEKSILVLYGANSAGKSTVLKGLGLNIVMAQIGCFVAADHAELSVFDTIMTRMTTYDSLSEGLSTFTMEMIELQGALKKADERSLYLFDEIGRGTSVSDGEAIAFGVLEFLNTNENKALTLFATHYHSLFEHIQNFNKISIKHFSCEVIGQDLIFSRRLIEGPGDGSYGLLVAKTCGLPESIIRVSENYRKTYYPLLESRYNKRVKGAVCELCKMQEAQETHHLIEQRQGKVKEVEVSGIKRNVHSQDNLVLLCGTCHRRVTKDGLFLKKRRTLSGFVLEIEDKQGNKKT